MTRLIANRDVRALLTVYVGDQLIDWTSAIALMLLVYEQTASALATASLLLCKSLVPAAAVPFAAAACDRLQVRQTAVLALLVCAGASAAMTVLPLAALWPLALLFEIFALLARSAIRGALPIIVSGDALRAGNGLLNACSALLAAIAPLAAAVVVVTAGAHVTLLAGAVIAVMTAAAAWRLPRQRPEDLPDERGAATQTDTARAVPVWVLLAGSGVLIALFSMDEPVLVAYAHTALHADDVAYGTLVSSWGAGLLAGALAYLRLRGRDPIDLALGFSALLSIGYLWLGAATTVTMAAAAAAVCGLANGVVFAAYVTAVQESVPPARQAQAAARIEAVGAAAAGIGFLAGGTLAALLSARAPFLIGGAGGLALSLLLALAARTVNTRRKPVGG
jgi:hypothetical protein